MKTKLFFILSSLLLLTGIYGCWTVSQDGYNNQSTYSQTYSSEYNQDDLNAYGEWIVLPEYGRVWRPSVDAQWQPFADGHWVYDGNDWVWDSYEAYGAIVYHYGNWEYVSNHRWIWIPNHASWSPACVDWVYYGDEVAWAPRPRPGHSFGNPWDNQGQRAWVVVRNENFYDNHVNSHRVTDVARDNGKYRDDQINRKQPPVSYVREHTQTSISVTKGINRNGNIRSGRPAESTPAPANNNPTPVTGTSTGRPSSTTPPTTKGRPMPASSQTPAAQTPATQPTATQTPVTQTPTTQKPGRNNGTPGRTEPAATNGGTTTTPAATHTTVGGKDLNPTPVKPQPAKSPVKVVRSSHRNGKRAATTTATPQQQQPAKNTQQVKKDNQAKSRQQPVEQKAAPARDKEEKRVEPNNGR